MTFSADVRARPVTLAGTIATRLPGVAPAQVEALAAKIKLLYGVTLAGSGPTGTAHGHISAISKPAGDPFARYFPVDGGAPIENDQCPMCDTVVPRASAHDCTEVVLYTSAEGPNKDHSTTFAPHGLAPAALLAIAALKPTDV